MINLLIKTPQTPVDTFVFSIGPAVDFNQLCDAMKVFAAQPWDLPPAVARPSQAVPNDTP